MNITAEKQRLQTKLDKINTKLEKAKIKLQDATDKLAEIKVVCEGLLNSSGYLQAQLEVIEEHLTPAPK